MNSMFDFIFTDESAEYTNLQAASPSIDLTDWECSGTPSTGICGTLTSGSSFLVTDPLASVGYFELEFMLANNFWGCNFSFGNSLCGIQIRQGIAHMFDKRQFCANSVIAGTCTPIDNPLPTTSGGALPTPNPCGYDTIQNPTSTTGCVVNGDAGTMYRINGATGANGIAWLYAPGSVDLNLAAQHLVNGGVATGFNSGTSRLTSPVSTNTPTFFIRNDNTPRRQLGESLAGQICFLFTGSYTQPCTPFLNTLEGPITAFPGFTTSKTTVNLSWWIYTAAFSGPTFFDGSLYFGYNSHFISASCASPGTVSCTTQQIGGGTCDNGSVGTASAGDYEYICVPNYDNLSKQMENAPCLTAQGDPAPGATSNLPTSPGNGICSGTSQLSAFSAGIQAEAAFGAAVLTLPMWEVTIQYGYLNNGWNNGVVNGAVAGLPNYFTWLDAWNSAPTQAGTIRQGFKETTRSVSPYISSTVWDTYITGEVYDSLFAANPLNPSQIFNWMTYSCVGCFGTPLSNSTVISTEGYTPPPHTLGTYHFTLRNDLYFQDGRPVTAYDVAFSYLSMVGSGAFLGTIAATMTGITVLGPRAFDISVNSLGPFEVPNITAIPIVSGRYWTGVGASSWDSAISACTGTTPCPKAQYALNLATVGCPAASGQPGCASPSPGASVMQIDPAKTSATYDPILNHTLVGSGPFECGPVTSSGSSTTCSSTGTQNPPTNGSYTLTRFGCTNATTCLAPASSTSGIYFRSSGGLGLYVWSEQNDANPIQPVSAVSLCFGLALGTGACGHWQQGIGANTATGQGQCSVSQAGCVGINQVSAVELRYNLNWIQPFEWASSSKPLGIVSTPPTLYEGTVTLSPCPPGGTSPPGSTTGYDC